MLVTPADIYSHFMHNQGLKPILKKPSVEENTQHDNGPADETIGDARLENPFSGRMENLETSCQKVTDNLK